MLGLPPSRSLSSVLVACQCSPAHASCCREGSRNFQAVYTDKLLTSQISLSDASEVSATALLLFGGDIAYGSALNPQSMPADMRASNGAAQSELASDELGMLKGWLRFESDARSAHTIHALRRAMDAWLAHSLDAPQRNAAARAEPLVAAVLEVLNWEEEELMWEAAGGKW